MNKKFFKGMGTLANVILVLGIIMFFIMLFTVTFVRVPDTSRYPTRYVVQLSATGFTSTVSYLVGAVVLYYFLNGMSLMGQRAFNDEASNENSLDVNIEPTTTTELVAPDDIKTTDRENVPTQVDETMKAQQEKSNNRWTTIASIICGIFALVFN